MMYYLKCKNKLKVVFVFQAGSFWPSWESLYEACMEDAGFEVRIFWLGMDEEAGDRAQMEFAEDFLIARNYPYEVFSYDRVMQFMPHVMVYQTPYDSGHRKEAAWTMRYKRKGIRIVYIPYGIEISDTEESRYKHFSQAPVLNAFAIYTISDEMKEEYTKYCMNAEAVRATGMPRFDSLLKQYELPKTVKEKAGGRKIILWKTHFPKVFIERGVKKQATPDLKEYIRFVEYIAGNEEIFFIFMPHPKFADETIDEMLLSDARCVLDRLERLSNVYIDREDDYRKSLTNADAIIIDRSAVMVEAGVKGVPVLYLYHTDYKEPMTPPIEKLLDSYYQGTTAAEMIRFCDDVMRGMDNKKEQRIAAFKECVPFCDGKCADRIREDLWDTVHEDIPFEAMSEIGCGKKTVIFGTGDLGHVCMSAYCDRRGRGFEVTCFADNDPKKQGGYFFGKEIISPIDLKGMDYDYIVIATDRYYREVYLQLTRELAIPRERLIKYDEFIIMMRFE